MAAATEDSSLASQCLDFCQMLAGKSLSFSFSLTVGTNFSFSLETRGKGALPSPKKKKKPTPSTLRRNARRREEFLKKKLASTAEKSQQEVSVEEAETPGKAPTVLHHHQSPSPSSGRRKVTTVGREKGVPTFSQLDGAPPAAPPAARKEMTSRCEFNKKPAPRYQPPPMKCDHCDLYLPWFVINWKGARMEPHHVCTCNS